jgi:hypothetical protein
MAGFSTYLASAIVGWLKGAAMPAAPAAIYVALWKGDPTDDATGGQEITAQIRTAGRVALQLGATTVAAGKSSAPNSAAVDFGNAANAVTGLSHFATFDAAVGGNMLESDALTGGARDVAAGTSVIFPIGSITVGAA